MFACIVLFCLFHLCNSHTNTHFVLFSFTFLFYFISCFVFSYTTGWFTIYERFPCPLIFLCFRYIIINFLGTFFEIFFSFFLNFFPFFSQIRLNLCFHQHVFVCLGVSDVEIKERCVSWMRGEGKRLESNKIMFSDIYSLL